jgi:hypothetical protein
MHTRFWSEKPDGTRLLRRLTHKWEDNIKTDLREIMWEVVDWMHMTQDRVEWWAVVNTVMNLRVPQKAENIFSS